MRTDRADFGEISELLERATKDLEIVFFLFEEQVEQRRQAPTVEASISRHSKGRTATLPEMADPMGERWVKPRLSSNPSEEGASLPHRAGSQVC